MMRTTDHRHVRQDRRIQAELVSTLAKKATKPNPFEIIPLQTTWKKDNWKTEETLARAALTLETKRINLQAPRFLYIGQAFRYSPEKAFYIFNQQIYFII